MNFGQHWLGLEDALRSPRSAERTVRGAAVALSRGELDLKKLEAAERQFDTQP